MTTPVINYRHFRLKRIMTRHAFIVDLVNDGCSPDERKDLAGQSFGFLHVIEPIVNPYLKGNETQWKCRRENCGHIVQVSSYWLRYSDPCGHCKCTSFSKP